MLKQTVVGVIGATSLVGGCLLSSLTAQGNRVIAFSRTPPRNSDSIEWRHAPTACQNTILPSPTPIHYWICAAPIWILPEYFDLLLASEVKRVVALSSTSRFTKCNSPDLSEQFVAKRIINAEAQLQGWAVENNTEWVILRPTLIYGKGRDKNICEIARFIQRFGFFPLFGQAKGLRQPLYAEDVAYACLSALESPFAPNKNYNLSGGETLSYKEMVCRIFNAMHRSPKLLPIQPDLFKLAIAFMRLLPRHRHLSLQIVERMHQDLVFNHEEAKQDLSFYPRPFQPGPEDLPK